MTTLEKRLMTLEIALKPQPEKRLIIYITRAGREAETPIAYQHFKTREIYTVDDDDINKLKGYNVLFGIYDDDDVTDFE